MSAPLETVTQRVASVVHITIDRNAEMPVIVEPETVHICYTHDNGTGDEMKPHSVVWEVFGLLSGEKVQIRMSSFPGVSAVPERVAKLMALFPRAMLHTTGAEWTIPYGINSAESGHAMLASDALGRFAIKYDVVFTDQEEHTFTKDPDVHLIPDP